MFTVGASKSSLRRFWLLVARWATTTGGSRKGQGDGDLPAVKTTQRRAMASASDWLGSLVAGGTPGRSSCREPSGTGRQPRYRDREQHAVGR